MAKNRQSLWAHMISILALPFNVTITIPLLLLFFFPFTLFWGLPFPYNLLLITLGAVVVIMGLVLVISTIARFAKQGKGTLAPWNPPQRLVVDGLYRYTRNPMISGVVFILIGEVVIAGSWVLVGWLTLFSIGSYFYFIWIEEPALEEKFGEDYVEYKKDVPRLFPRRKPWSKRNT